MIYVYLLALALRVLDSRGAERRTAAGADPGPSGWLAFAAAISVFVTLV